MDAITYGATRGSARAAGNTDKPAQARHGWFARFMEALSESRRRQALREIQKHAHLLPYTLVERGNRLVKTGNRDMPFGV